MKILLASPSMQPAGAERVLTLLAGELAERGHGVSLIAPLGPRDADLDQVPHRRITLHDRGRTPFGVALEAVELARAIRRIEPDLVHAQNPRIAATAGIAARIGAPSKRPRVLATFHGVLPSEYGRAARLLRLTDHVVCVSGDLRDQLIAGGAAPERISVVYNAVDEAQALSPQQRADIDEELGLDGAPVAAIAARIVPQKAHARFVQAAAVAVRRLPSLRLLIIGEGPLRPQTEAAVRAAGITENVVFTGMRSDARLLIARSDVLVFSSDWEGLSIAALEAMAAGTPVLSTDVQGMRELLGSGAGEIVPPDDGTILGERLADLLLAPQRRESMAAAGHQLIESRHTVAAMTEAYETLYQQLASRRGLALTPAS
jgi:glycosyltransferase involved in cell wall biosynthesis